MTNICALSAESVTAVFTVVLAAATSVLGVVTWLLARNTKKDFTIRKREATVSAWSEVRKAVPAGGFQQLEAHSELTLDQKAALREIEYFSTCVNSGVYDEAIFVGISRSWFLQQYEKIRPYIGSRRNARAYAELRALYEKVSTMRAGGETVEDD